MRVYGARLGPEAEGGVKIDGYKHLGNAWSSNRMGGTQPLDSTEIGDIDLNVSQLRDR